MNKNVLITALEDNDVLLGRGTGPNTHQGNMRFRVLSLELLKRAEFDTFADQAATKRTLAKRLVEMVKARKGRFVRKLNRVEASTVVREVFQTSDKKFLKKKQIADLYVVVTDDVAVEKAKQSFRHQLRVLERTKPQAPSANQREITAEKYGEKELKQEVAASRIQQSLLARELLQKAAEDSRMDDLDTPPELTGTVTRGDLGSRHQGGTGLSTSQESPVHTPAILPLCSGPSPVTVQDFPLSAATVAAAAAAITVPQQQSSPLLQMALIMSIGLHLGHQEGRRKPELPNLSSLPSALGQRTRAKPRVRLDVLDPQGRKSPTTGAGSPLGPPPPLMLLKAPSSVDKPEHFIFSKSKKRRALDGFGPRSDRKTTAIVASAASSGEEISAIDTLSRLLQIKKRHDPRII